MTRQFPNSNACSSPWRRWPAGWRSLALTMEDPRSRPGTEGRVTRPGLPCVSDGDDDEASAYLEAQGALAAKLKVVLATTFGSCWLTSSTASADVTMLAKSSALAKCCRAPLSGSGPSILGPSLACAAIVAIVGIWPIGGSEPFCFEVDCSVGSDSVVVLIAGDQGALHTVRRVDLHRCRCILIPPKLIDQASSRRATGDRSSIDAKDVATLTPAMPPVAERRGA